MQPLQFGNPQSGRGTQQRRYTATHYISFAAGIAGKEHDMATRHMSVGSLKPIVDRTGAESSDFQFVREAYQNACEADATKVRIRWEQGASRQGVYRFEIADNGRSMTRNELPTFINKFGGGGKPIGDQHENYGVGLKSSTMPWNHHGIFVVARRNDETNLILLHLDESANEYGLRQWATEDQQGDRELTDVLTIAQRVEGKWQATCDRDWAPVKGTRIRDLLDAFVDERQGTVIVLCGNTGKENTFLALGAGGQFGKAGHTAIATYLSRRYWKLPVPVVVYEPRNGDLKNWPRSPDEFAASHINVAGNSAYRVKSRNPLGLGDFLREGGERGAKKPEVADIVDLADGTKVYWYLLPEGQTYDGKGAGGMYWNPSVVVKYRSELYPSGGTQRQRFREFGISRTSVIDRCTLVLEPPENATGQPGVYPDSSRSRLLWTGGTFLPWSRWAREFASSLPNQIQEALSKATAELGRLTDQEDLNDSQKRRLKALTDRLRSSWRRKARPTDAAERVKIVRVSLAGTGSTTTRTGGGNGGGGSGKTNDRRKNRSARVDGTDERYVEDADGELLPTVEVRRPDQIPECQWLPVDDFDDQYQAARWNETSFVVEGNLGCPIFQESIDYWTMQYPSVEPDDIAKAVRKVYGFKLRGVAAHMLTAKRRGAISADDLTRALDPLSLTAASAGFVVEDIALAGDIGALAGKAKARLRVPK
jgi:hypothetical protein